MKGRKFPYQLRAAAKTKDIQFRKVNGPAEAKVNELGLITWDVPADEDKKRRSSWKSAPVYRIGTH